MQTTNTNPQAQKKEDISRLENDGWTPDSNTECSVQLEAAQKLFWESLEKAETYLGASSSRADFETLRKFIHETKEKLEKIAGPNPAASANQHH
jgi:hypothetical protein